ncbi:PepSY domain-containing protein [Bradyrhizobium sp. 930_D9_N1_4]|uniref:PepSY domain-containing protein n=1 Tax=Bradyrhizobium sp. 930_D9_N1_4 TaxID=3240374 RepID=UPI003F8CCA3C
MNARARSGSGPWSTPWTSLISTVFLLLLCLTGLPLIFHPEIDELPGYAPQSEAHASAARATTQAVDDAALDLLTVVVIGGGLYLWLARRRKRVPAKAGAFARRAPVPS